MPAIDEGTRAIIELTAERAAKAAVAEHRDHCPIASAWRASEARQRSARAVAVAAVAALGTAVVALAKAVSGGH